MLRVVKIGGNIVDNPEKLDRFLSDFASLDGAKILVHGGGKVATTIAGALGIETQMIEGRRVTDRQTLDVVTMVYGGLINKSIVAKLQKLGCNAIGLSGADGEFILSKRRDPNPVDYGFVGDPEFVNSHLVKVLTDNDMTVVAAPLTYDKEGGTLLNTNADTVASSIAVAMAQAGRQTELIYCFEKRGVLSDVDNDESVIPHIDPLLYASLKAGGQIFQGMLPKLDNAFRAIESGVESVVICSAEMIAAKGYGGTTITR